jgi:branched-chain amino acid transport system ATP-binding protein
MSAVPVLETRGLGRRFGGLQAVSDVSFSVPAGQVLGVIGPNGAGKSTFINLVTGHIKPTEGRVLIDGKDLTGARPWVIAQAGVARTFQIVKPFRGMSVRENVAVGILYGSNGTNVMSKALKAAEEVLEEVGMAGLAHQVSFPSPTPGGWSSPRRSRFAPGCSCSMR